MTFTLGIGDTITTVEELREAPIGTLLRVNLEASRREYGWQKRGPDIWEESNGVHHSGNRTPSANIRVTDGWKVADLPLEGVPALRLIKWRIRDGALNGTASQGVSFETAQRALEASGADAAQFPWSADQKVSNRFDLERIPAGSVVHVGRPDNIEKYTVYYCDGGGVFNRLFGPGAEKLASTAQPAVWIDTISGGAPPGTWTTDPPASAKDIAVFKKAIWDAGWEAKQRHGWCETYEFIMERLGVTAADANYREPDGDGVFTAAGDGVVFSYRQPVGTGWALVVRDRTRGSGMRFLIGHGVTEREVGQDYLVRLGEPGEACLFVIPRTTLTDFTPFPMGTLFECGATRYQVTGDHRARGVDRTKTSVVEYERRGDYQPADFGNAPFTILRFGVWA